MSSANPTPPEAERRDRVRATTDGFAHLAELGRRLWDAADWATQGVEPGEYTLSCRVRVVAGTPVLIDNATLAIRSAPASAEALAQRFHEAYERLAPSFGYATREASAKPWAEVPENNRRLMTAVCAEILSAAPPSENEGLRAARDTARLDWLEAEIRAAAERGEHACVVLGAWYSRPGGVPDGYSVGSGDLIVDAAEYPTLRDAIDEARER